MNFWLIGLKVIGAKVEKIENVLGLSTDDISHVIITPIQDYTIGRINLFKKAMIYFSKKGWFSDVVNPSPSPFLNRDIYLPICLKKLGIE
ncbi:MAG: hypothetical protein QW281_05235 [Saccharolobus sp.]